MFKHSNTGGMAQRPFQGCDIAECTSLNKAFPVSYAKFQIAKQQTPSEGYTCASFALVFIKPDIATEYMLDEGAQWST